MAAPEPPTSLIRFGVFELDPRAGELRKKGVRVRLQEQPFQVLLMLLERPGEVVTREEFQKRLWPDGTFVDFEHGLNAAVNRLRDALGDTSDNPIFVETIPRRGYRFNYPLAGTSAAPAAAPETPASAKIARSPWLWSSVLALIIGVVILASLGLLPRLREPAAPVAPIQAVAVLPLDNLSGDPAQEPFVDGMTEELIMQLGKISALKRVISRQSVMQYRSKQKPLPEIARELRVDALIVGSVLQAQGRVRVNVQLMGTTPEQTFWSKSYERDLRDVLALHGEVASNVADEIRVFLTHEERARLASTGKVNPDAYLDYVKGRHYWHKLTPEALVRATEHFQRAVETDPTYARAWLGLGDSWRMRGSWWGDMPSKQAFPLAKQALQKALELDPTLGEAHGSLAWIRFVYDWDWAAAEAEFKQAIAISPNSRDAHSPYANFLRWQGRLQEAQEQLERCLEIDPLAPLELNEAALLYLQLKQPDRAFLLFRRAYELDPNSAPGTSALLNLYNAQQKTQEMLIAAEEAEKRLGGGFFFSRRIVLLVSQGRKTEARNLLRQAEQTMPWRGVAIAGGYTRLGDKEQAMAWLERAFQARDAGMVWLRGVPRDSVLGKLLWEDPRFQDLLRRMNFPK